MEILFYLFLLKIVVSSFTEAQINILKVEPKVLHDFEKSEYFPLFENSELTQLPQIDFTTAENIIDPLLAHINTMLNGLFKGKVSIKQQNELKYKLNLVKLWAINTFHLNKFNTENKGILAINSNKNFVYVNQGYFQFEKHKPNKVLMTWGAGPCVILIIKGFVDNELVYGLAHLDSDSDDYLDKGNLKNLLQSRYTQIESAFIISGLMSENKTIKSTIHALANLLSENQINKIKVNKEVVDAGIDLETGQVYLLNPYINAVYNIVYTPLIEISKQLGITEPVYFLDKNYGNLMIALDALYLGKYKTYEIYKNKNNLSLNKHLSLVDDMKKLIDQRN